MTAQDLFREVPFERLRPGVPRSDQTLGIEHEDGISLDRFHQELEMLHVFAGRDVANESSEGF
jgi:hypothetical protein